MDGLCRRGPWLAALLVVAGLTLGAGLGSASRLTYHEAIVAQAAREMVATGDLLVPRLGGQPWLEKPPLSIWLIAGLARLAGGVDEGLARLPSAAGALGLALAVARLARRRWGVGVGRVAGLVQLTTSWCVVRGRLAEVDILLAALVTLAFAALDELRQRGSAITPRVLFFVLLGLTSLAKGVGFGAVIVLTTVLALLLWDRDGRTLRALAWPTGWMVALLIALTWPLLVLARHPEAGPLWLFHSVGRLTGAGRTFAGEPWGLYILSPLEQTLPWSPLALAGAWRSWKRAKVDRLGPDRLLVLWAILPALLVSLSRSRNAHYLIYALPPWSIWAAIGLGRLGDRLSRRGWTPEGLRRLAAFTFVGCGLGWAAGFGLLGPRLDHRGVEWSWYETAGRALRPGEPLVLLYDDWDREPYPTPFGPVPHDLAVRLFYLDRPASCRFGVADLAEAPPAPRFAVIGRDRDVPELRHRLGPVEELVRGPKLRARHSIVDDRAFVLFRVTLAPDRLAHEPLQRSAMRSR